MNLCTFADIRGQAYNDPTATKTPGLGSWAQSGLFPHWECAIPKETSLPSRGPDGRPQALQRRDISDTYQTPTGGGQENHGYVHLKKCFLVLKVKDSFYLVLFTHLLTPRHFSGISDDDSALQVGAGTLSRPFSGTECCWFHTWQVRLPQRFWAQPGLMA